MLKKVVISGSREFDDYKIFCSVVNKYLSKIKRKYKIVILSGHCRGTDLMAERYAKENNLELEVYLADWKRYGRSAGPKRNRQMVEQADYAIAFTSGGRGTESLIEMAFEREIPTIIYRISL